MKEICPHTAHLSYPRLICSQQTGPFLIRVFSGNFSRLGRSKSDESKSIFGLSESVYFETRDRWCEDTDFAALSSGYGDMPGWLERVEVRSLDDTKIKFDAWKMRNLEVYQLYTFHERRKYPAKGYEVDWPPYIGNIS